MLLVIGGFDTPFATSAQGYSTTEVGLKQKRRGAASATA